MTRIILSGCGGAMGKVVSSCAADRSDIDLVAGIDHHADQDLPYPLYSSPDKVDRKADVLIDFSHPTLLYPLLEFGKKTKTPLVLCTTGYDKEQVRAVEDASREIPIFYSRNMSLGINLLIELARKAESVLGTGFDVEIVEAHHNQKIDAPSGTALMIANAVADVSGGQMHYMYDRHSQRKKRSENEIGIHSIRGGTIVGEHKVVFAGPHEILTISHSAQSKEIFAHGALNAAIFLSRKGKGLYSMADLIRQED
ncbi:4-hydroxy-tetrahydrodipicolinate reductase [Caproiciproducens sp. NJN-50]|uniref:4-hydroxy-tetrahydrodipicolinate reductase n=1 Tax=Acutalibacteraceae TaxID=3082771 RepID=UPI000FFE0532|nr:MULTISPECIES: 4-hydroxy-tetrahydrodipicolinate reductase [Acutalibacteraceae]QAT49703.1 4-hydroxy-tetrahydrodipicolinate reductase [Caproiciproducens sp. NJN-50]